MWQSDLYEKIIIGLVLLTSVSSFASLSLQGDRFSKDEFSRVIGIAKPIFMNKAAERGIELKLQAYWGKETVNAETLVIGNNSTISIYGGIFRMKELSIEGFAVVLCHELGHVLGGFPYFGDFNNTVEGGADYYSSNDCLKELFPKLGLRDNLEVTSEVSEICSNELDQLTCKQVLMGGYSLMNALLNRLPNNTVLNYMTPDQAVAPQTLMSYPSYQCRLDTVLRGYFNLERPVCWFNKLDPANSGDDDDGSITI